MKLSSMLGIQPGVTAIIGSGGKSTALRILSEELPGKVLLCTSTHFTGYSHLPMVLNPTEKSLRDAFAQHKVICAARRTAEEKLVDCGLSYQRLQEIADYVIVEADGSRRLPLKAHAFHEPAIPCPCRQVICVVGLSGLKKTISDTVHRPEIFCALTGATAEDVITPSLVADGLLQERLTDTFFLNQADTPDAMDLAYALAARLTAAGCTVVAGSLRHKTYQLL